MDIHYYYYIGTLVFIVGAYLTFLYFKRRYDNKVVPYAVGRKTIFIQRKEIAHFSAMSKNDQRIFINRFYAQVKAGKFLPVYKHGKVVGYVRNNAWKKT